MAADGVGREEQGRLRLRRLEIFTLVVVLVAGVVAGVYGYTVDPTLQLAGIAFWFVLGALVLVGAVLAFTQWSRDRWRALVVLGLALGGFVLTVVAMQAGIDVRDRQFVRQMAPYEQLAGAFQSGAVQAGKLPVDSLPTALKGCCYLVQGNRDSTGVWQVEFLWARGFPTHHSAWVYSSGTSRVAVKQRGRWYHADEVAPHWYRVSD